jgi:carbamate kinase
MRIVIALGGNALLRRGQPMTAENQRANIRAAAERIAEVVDGNQIVVAHGNGPQVGLLALQAAAYVDVPAYPLDVLGAQTEAMIGYVIEQELGNLLPEDQPLATLLTMVEVDRDDPAFTHPTKPIGPVYPREQAVVLAENAGWSIAPDGDGFRRVVPSPKPKRIFEIKPIRQLLEQGTIVVCAGGGGIPTMFDEHGDLHGVEAVVDKDATSAMLAEQLDADLLVIATDVDAVYLDWGTPQQRRLDRATPDELDALGLAEGSMGPKVRAAARFARDTGHRAAIGSLDDVARLVAGTAGTVVENGG